MGTNLSLFPFPVTFIKDSLKNKSEIFKLINSDTLNPQLYNNSTIATFLFPVLDVNFTLEMISSISSIVRVDGKLEPILGV